MRGVNRSRAWVSPDCHADNSLVTAWRSGSGMAAAIVLLSGSVSETGPFLACECTGRSARILPPMASQSRRIRAAIPVRLSPKPEPKLRLGRGYPLSASEKCPDCRGFCLVAGRDCDGNHMTISLKPVNQFAKRAGNLTNSSGRGSFTCAKSSRRSWVVSAAIAVSGHRLRQAFADDGRPKRPQISWPTTAAGTEAPADHAR